MAITRYSYRNPWRELDQLSNRLTRAMQQEWDLFPTPSNAGSWVPAVSVEETTDELVLTAELPGMTADDVDVSLENNVLTIRGEKATERTEDRDDERRYHLWERSFGSFQRSFTLPRTVRGDEISADFENGLLRITMPKAPEARSRRIDIGAGRNTKEIEAGES